MSQSDDDDYAFLGTPLEQFDEDVVPRKKPVTIQDQIATDKHGRRRFHGAFTGGFSAGFFNTVGSLEGWKPSAFKSSRDKKADAKYQKPEDFMDDEDLEQFGIAPTVVRAKPEYSGKVHKRERVQFSDGPIPGEPVLKSILEPVKETVGVLLLIKMGWKPGQGIGPRLTRLQKKKESLKSKIKVYGCQLPDLDDKSDSDDGEDIANLNLLFSPEEHELHFLHPKTNTFGMGYSGLDKNLLSTNSTQKDETFRMFDNNKKLSIKGQAFGVGAFEDDDDDIYARDDMSQYDFSLESSASLRQKRKKEREAGKLLQITNNSDVLEGFVVASKPLVTKKFFPPPELPLDYEPVHPKRKTRFDKQTSNLNSKGLKGKHYINAEERAAIIGDKRPKKADESRSVADFGGKGAEPVTVDNLSIEGFRPFIADPEKQQRYEKYLHFIRIGAKDAFPSIQPKSMCDWEKEREINEFEQAARLYKPLSGIMAERFAHGELPDDSTEPLSAVPKSYTGEDPDMVQAAKSKMYGKLTRRITDWFPCSILCKRMNIAEPANSSGISLSEVANSKNKNRSKFSVFNFLDTAKGNSMDVNEGEEETLVEEKQTSMDVNETTKQDQINVLILPKPKSDFEEPLVKKDLFKAIFCSDEENSDTDENVKDNVSTVNKKTLENIEPPQGTSTNVANVLRNTSPPKGIFANLDLDALNKRKTTLTSSTTNIETKESDKVLEVNQEKINETFLYGPSLPTKPLFSKKQKDIVINKSSDSSSEEEWVERKDDKVKKKHKKHKKNKYKKKHKEKNKKK